jgi:polysaccharide export outer membrane protein
MMSHRLNRSLTALLLTLGYLTLYPNVWGQFVAPAPTSSEGLNIPRPVTTDPAILYPETREITLLPGDEVSVKLLNTTFSAVSPIAMDGTIQMPQLGKLKIAGLSVEEAEDAINARLTERQMYVDPEVSLTLTVATSHIATVLGEVRGTVPILTKRRLFDVLATVGGLPKTASHIVTITRPGVDQPIVVDVGIDPARSVGTNIPIFAGDTITVGAVGSFYVIGGIKTPGVHPLDGSLPTTVMEAISLSGGGNFSSKMNQTRLIRTIGSQRTVVEVPVKKILQGKAPDPILQADDIIYVPVNLFKAFVVEGGLTTAFGLFYTVETAAHY